jgi:hypothetical protein
MQGPAPQPTANCAFCGKPLAMGEINYTPDARPACNLCNGRVDVVVADMRVGGNIKSSAIVAIVFAAIQFVFNPFLVCTIASLVPALYALRSVSRSGDERFTQHIARDRGWIMALAIISLVLDALVIILFLVIVVLAFGGSSHSRY